MKLHKYKQIQTNAGNIIVNYKNTKIQQALITASNMIKCINGVKNKILHSIILKKIESDIKIIK